MPYNRADFRVSAMGAVWYFLLTLILVPLDEATLASPLALARSLLTRLAIVLAAMAASYLFIGTQGAVFDSILPKTATEAAPETKEPLGSRPLNTGRWFIVIFAGLWVTSRLCSDWAEFVPARFTVHTAFAWGWLLFISLFLGSWVRPLFVSADPVSQKLRLTIKIKHLISFTALFLVADFVHHFDVIQNPPSMLYLVRACIRNGLGDLCLGASFALIFPACKAAVKNAGPMLSRILLPAGVFALIVCFDRKSLLAIQPGGVTIMRLVADLVFALIIGFLLNALIRRRLAPIQLQSVVPHPLDPPPGDRNSAAASGV
jgi:hypothetical protein